MQSHQTLTFNDIVSDFFKSPYSEDLDYGDILRALKNIEPHDQATLLKQAPTEPLKHLIQAAITHDMPDVIELIVLHAPLRQEIVDHLMFCAWDDSAPNDIHELVARHSSHISQRQKNECLMMAGARGNLTLVKKSLDLGADPQYWDSISKLSVLSASVPHWEVFSFLWPLVQPIGDVGDVLRYAAGKAHLEQMRVLLPHATPQNCHDALYGAIDQRNYDAVGVLYPFCEQEQAHHIVGRSIVWAAHQNDVQMIKQLLPFSDPNEQHIEALKAAAHQQLSEIVDLLYPLCDRDVVQNLIDQRYMYDFPYFSQLRKALAIHDALSDRVETTQPLGARHKKM